MLRACHRILKPGGIIAFAVVASAEKLSDRDLAAAIEAGPPYVEARPGYQELMVAAGFNDASVTDVTEEFRTTARACLREWADRAPDLGPIVGIDRLTEEQSDQRRTVDAIEQGLLRRYLITAHRR